MPVARGDEVLVLADRYVVEQELAAGGMGSVHIARDERLGRRVAVKLLRDDLAAGPEFVERFRREALTAAGLVHPGIAQVYDYGFDGGAHFIVMEYVAGGDLARLLRSRRLDRSEAAEIAAQVCDALSAAHRAGVVHRDIKPGNVIVTPDGHVKVTDFGIARALGHSTITQAGKALGTPAYLSPEVARGEAADATSDLYAVGILLYEMLTGAVPFQGESPVAVALRHLTEQVPRPSALVPGLPRYLDEVVARATAASRTDRYPDADAMARALRLGTAGAGAAATPALTQQLGAAPEPTRVLGLPMGATAVRTPPSRASRHGGPAGPSRPTRRFHPLVWALGAAVLVLVVTLGVLLLTEDNPVPTGSPAPALSATSKPAPSRTATPTATRTTTRQPAIPTMPDNLVGLGKDEAKAALENLGFDVKTVDVRAQPDKGQVLATFPAAGQLLRQGQTVLLVVSRGGSQDEQGSPGWLVPDGLVGTSLAAVRDQLPRRDLRVVVESIDAPQPAGTIIGTYPAPGEPLTGRQLLLVTSARAGGD